jgi:hypothetical protein
MGFQFDAYRTATTIRFSESSFHRPEAAEKNFVSCIPFLIWVDLVSRLHAIRFTRLHETKLCLRLRACRQVCKFNVGLSKRELAHPDGGMGSQFDALKKYMS